MPAQPPSWTRAWTYLLALGIGWVGMKGVPRPHDEDRTAGPAIRGTGRPAGNEDARAMLDRLEIAQKKVVPHAVQLATVETRLEARVKALCKTLPPSADRAEAVWESFVGISEMDRNKLEEISAYQEQRAVVIVRIIQWLEQDREEALDFLELNGSRVSHEYEAALRIWTMDQPFESLLALAANSETSSEIMRGILNRIASKGDLDELSRVRATIRKSNPNAMYQGIGKVANQWPQEQIGALLAKAVEWKESALLTEALKRLPSAGACAAIRSFLATGEGRETIRGAGDQELLDLIFGNEAMSVEERVAMMKQFEGAGKTSDWRAGPKKFSEMIRNAEASKLAESGETDLVMRAFRRGELDGAEAEARMTAGLPGAMGVDPVGTRLEIAKWLLEIDPARAMPLMKGLPPGLRIREVYRFLDQWREPRCDQVLALFEAMPFDPDREDVEVRLSVWDSVVSNNDSAASRKWIRAMPVGLNKDMALSALADLIAQSDPEAAATVRLEISNPEALEK